MFCGAFDVFIRELRRRSMVSGSVKRYLHVEPFDSIRKGRREDVKKILKSHIC